MKRLRLAWRNVLRNRKRTAITVTAVGLNTAVLIVTYALVEGMLAQAVRSITHTATGDAQAHHPEYRVERSIYDTLEDPERLLAAAAALEIRAAPRSFGYGLLAAEEKSAGGAFWGVDPQAERRAFELPERLRAGAFGPEAAGRAVLGGRLAKSLDVEVGDEIVAVVQAADGSLGNELLTVGGILSAVGDEIDRGGVLLHRADFARLFVTAGVHEIAFSAAGRMSPEMVVAHLRPAAPTAALETWRELLPAASDMVNLSSVSTSIMAIVFLLAAGLGVLNTMLMATHDRVREFGLVKALGASPTSIVIDISIESVVLALIAAVPGAALGVAGALYLERVGVDLTGFGGETMSISGTVWDLEWHAQLQTADVLFVCAAMTVTSVLASLYPAVKAARLNPVAALTHV